ncbi:MAG: PDZ domain-containing protein [Peptococcaceae bacterium]|nr:PDZ domain-containing protein [Peptococcaceae bacterium]
MPRRPRFHFYLILVLVLSFSLALSMALTGCTSKYQTKPDYQITEKVATDFMTAYQRGDLAAAMENVAEDAVLSTDTGNMKGKSTIEELLKLNIEKENTMEIAGKEKIDESKIALTIDNKIPLFKLAGVDVIKTVETFEVQDGKIVKWEIKYLKESVDFVEKASAGTTGLEAEVRDGKIVVTHVMPKSPAAFEQIKVGDTILTIDGTELKDMRYGAEELPYRLIGQVGTKVDLKIKSDEEEFEVTLTRVDINSL